MAAAEEAGDPEGLSVLHGQMSILHNKVPEIFSDFIKLMYCSIAKIIVLSILMKKASEG